MDKTGFPAGRTAIVVLYFVVLMLPIYWLLNMSFRDTADILAHFEIFPSSVLDGDSPPDYLLIFAWSFFDEIRKKNGKYLARGGRMILPLPEVLIFPPPAS